MPSLSSREAIEPEGLAAQLLGVTIMFSIVCTVVVGLRIWLRHFQNCIGLEDWLMVAGMVRRERALNSFASSCANDFSLGA